MMSESSCTTAMTQIRAICSEDFEALFAWRNHPDYLEVCASRGRVSQEEFEQELYLDFAPDEVEQFVILARSTGESVGTIFGYDWREQDRYLSLTIFVAPEHRLTGIGPDAVALILRHLFTDLGVYKVYMDVYDCNHHSVNLLRRIGFRQEGRFVKQHLRGGERCDVLRFAVFADDLLTITSYLRART